jgi:Protein kinase domain
MNTPHTCPKCGASLPTDAPEGLCPACLMSGGFDTDATVKMTPSQRPSPAPHFAPTPTPEALAPLFPQLEILELLGRGGMGTVYKARQPKLNRFVALKIISGEAAADPHFAERFQREAQALAKLNHPNIVSVFDFGEARSGDIPVAADQPDGDKNVATPWAAPGIFYFLMEYVDGTNLRSLMQSGEMKPEAALALIPAFCDALQYAHDEGVVHRDIKPENVLVDKKGRVKIADFGLAKLTGADAHDHTLTRTGMYLGTPRYMAPEQVEKPETVDHRADIYSLGVVFYEMLTGELPMGRFDPPSKKVQVDVKLDDIVLRSLEKDVERRYQHASEIKTDVQSVAAAAATSTPPAAAPFPAIALVAADAAVQPRLSRMALIGAIWAGFGLLAVVSAVLFTTLDESLAAGRPMQGRGLRWTPITYIMFWLIFVGAGAPIGTTILGAISMNKIKKPGGKLYGLPLAFADTIFFPMLLLHGAMAVLLGLLIVTIMKLARVNASLGMAEMGLVAMLPLIADFFIVRALWRKTSEQTTTKQPSVTAPAVWMLIGAVASSIMVLFLVSETYPNYTKGQFSAAGMVIRYAVLCAFAVTAVMTIRGALKMLGKEDYAASRQAAVCSIFSIVGIITLPAGIWALVRLNRPEVKALFVSPSKGTAAQLNPLDHRISEAFTSGLPGWFAKRALWMQKLIQTTLGIAMAFALIFFLSYNKSQDTGLSSAGYNDAGSLELGAPGPWFTMNYSARGSSWGFHPFASSVWIALAGIAVYWLYDRFRRVLPGFDAAKHRRTRKFELIATLVCIAVVLLSFFAVFSIPGMTLGKRDWFASSTPLIVAEKVEKRETNHYRFRYKITTPPDHRVLVWMETTREGRPVVIPGLANNISSSMQLGIGEAFDGDAEFSLVEGDRLTPTSNGKWRWDFKFGSQSARVSPGGWIENPFAGMSTNFYRGPERWQPKPGEEVSILVIRAGNNLSYNEPTVEPPSGEIELRLKARIDPVPLFHRVQGVITSSLRDPFPTPATPLGRIAAGFRIDPKLPDDEIHRQLIEALRSDAAKRLNAEVILKSVGKPVTKETKPEDVLKVLVTIASQAQATEQR